MNKTKNEYGIVGNFVLMWRIAMDWFDVLYAATERNIHLASGIIKIETEPYASDGVDDVMVWLRGRRPSTVLS